jgi:hypothetical protein
MLGVLKRELMRIEIERRRHIGHVHAWGKKKVVTSI